MNKNLVLVEATVYDNITEANGRQEVLNALREQESELAALRSELEAVKAERDEFERLAQLSITELKDYHDGWNEELGTNCIGSDICTTAKLIKELAAALKGGKG